MQKDITVCIIDDDSINQFALRRTIEINKLAYKVLVFGDGEDAIQYITANLDNNSNLPDIVFLDINMPITDGWQFLEEYIMLKPKIKKEISIYMISSSNDSVDLDRAKKINELSDYIVKPVTLDTLKSTISKVAMMD